MLTKSKQWNFPAVRPDSGRIPQGVHRKAGDLKPGRCGRHPKRELARPPRSQSDDPRRSALAISRTAKGGRRERRRGVGTFVSAPKIHFKTKLMSYTEQIGQAAASRPSQKSFSPKLSTTKKRPPARNSRSLQEAASSSLATLRSAAGRTFARRETA